MLHLLFKVGASCLSVTGACQYANRASTIIAQTAIDKALELSTPIVKEELKDLTDRSLESFTDPKLKESKKRKTKK